MIISRYEEAKDDALKNIRRAMCENNYICDDEYIIAIENITDGYNVDFTHTDDGGFADEVFDEDCDAMRECALAHRGDEYITVLAKCLKCGYVEVIRERHYILNK